MPEGEVHAYAWAALTRVAVQQETLDSTSKAVIDSHRAAMTSPDMIADVVYIATLTKVFNKGEFKLFLPVSPAHHSLLEAVSAGVFATGTVEKKCQVLRAACLANYRRWLTNSPKSLVSETVPVFALRGCH